MSRNEPIRIRFRLYPGQDPDDALIEWLAQFDMPGTPHGAKSRALKRALRLGIQRDCETGLDADAIRAVVEDAVRSSVLPIDQGVLGKAVREAVEQAAREGVFALPFTLADIRRVVAVTVEQKLDHLNSCSSEDQASSEHNREDSAVEDGLDRLGKSVVHWIDE
jgi:hypothetical protein